MECKDKDDDKDILERFRNLIFIISGHQFKMRVQDGVRGARRGDADASADGCGRRTARTARGWISETSHTQRNSSASTQTLPVSCGPFESVCDHRSYENV